MGSTRTRFELEIPGEPKSKARPRIGAGGAFTPKSTKAHETLLRAHFMGLVPSPLRESLSVEAIFYRSNRQRVDLDNMLKALLDAGNKLLWEDDSQIVQVSARLEYDPARPRTFIKVCAETSSMARGPDAEQIVQCEGCGKDIVWKLYESTKPRRFCSRECTGGGVCRRCGKAFQRATQGQVFCSGECRERFHEQARRDRRPERALPRCVGCGAGLKRQGATYCVACYRKNVTRY